MSDPLNKQLANTLLFEDMETGEEHNAGGAARRCARQS